MTTCPRRFEVDNELVLDEDDYVVRDHMLICTFCGSVEPGLFLDCIRRGVKITPTDKNYKVYCGALNGNFYFQHFSEEQQEEFLDLYNADELTIDEPGFFHVIPYFASPTADNRKLTDAAKRWLEERGQ